MTEINQGTSSPRDDTGSGDAELVASLDRTSLLGNSPPKKPLARVEGKNTVASTTRCHIGTEEETENGSLLTKPPEQSMLSQHQLEVELPRRRLGGQAQQQGDSTVCLRQPQRDMEPRKVQYKDQRCQERLHTQFKCSIPQRAGSAQVEDGARAVRGTDSIEPVLPMSSVLLNSAGFSGKAPSTYSPPSTTRTPDSPTAKQAGNEEENRRREFRAYWECALQAFGISEDGMLLKAGAKEVGFSDADGEEILRVITHEGLSGDAKLDSPTPEREQHDLPYDTCSTELLCGKTSEVVSHEEISPEARVLCPTGTPPCLLESLRFKNAATEEGAGDAPVEPMPSTTGATLKWLHSKASLGAEKKTATKAHSASKKPNAAEGKLSDSSATKNIGPGEPEERNYVTAGDAGRQKGSAEQTTERGVAGKKKTSFTRALELGAGIGRLTKLLQTVADEIVAVDFIREFVEENRRANGKPLERLSAAHEGIHTKSQDACFNEKFDLVVINWLLMYLSTEEVTRLIRKIFATWSTADALIFIRESCGEPSDKGISSREWATGGNPTVYRSHQEYTRVIEDEARRAGVDIQFVAKARPTQVYWKRCGTDSQRYWVLRRRN